jgi:putative ABC transport system ATP-binding protein
MEPLLEFQQVAKRYRRGGMAVDALVDVDLRLSGGEFLAIRGASGSGKTTLLLTAGTMLTPDAGHVQLAGERPYAMSSDRRAALRARQVGFVFQQFHLVPYLSVLENVLAPSVALGGGGDRSWADELIERFGLTGRAHHLPGQLSSGERQRCALARALLNRPKLLLADEPTGNLDPDNARLVLESLRRFADQGGGVLLVTHDPDAAAAADSVLWMRNGRLSDQPQVVGAV